MCCHRIVCCLVVALAALASCSSRSASTARVEPPVDSPRVMLYLDGVPALQDTARPYPGRTEVRLDIEGNFVPGSVEVDYWSPRRRLFVDSPDRSFVLPTVRDAVLLNFDAEGRYVIVGVVPLGDGATARSPMRIVEAVAFNARMRLERTVDGRVPMLGIEEVTFGMQTLAGAPVSEFSLLGPGFFLPGMSASAAGFFGPQTGRGGVYSAETEDRGLFTPRMTALYFADGGASTPQYGYTPLEVWDGDPRMPRYELTSGDNRFALVIDPQGGSPRPSSLQSLRSGSIRLRDRVDGSEQAFDLDLVLLEVVVTAPVLSQPTLFDVRAQADFGGGDLLTEWLPILVVP